MLRGYICLRACSMVQVLMDFFHQGKHHGLFSWVLLHLVSSLLPLLAGCNTCSQASEKLELNVSHHVQGWCLEQCPCIVLQLLWRCAPFHALSRCLAAWHQWLPFDFAGWKSSHKTLQKQKWAALSLANSSPIAWAFRHGQYWIKLG